MTTAVGTSQNNHLSAHADMTAKTAAAPNTHQSEPLSNVAAGHDNDTPTQRSRGCCADLRTLVAPNPCNAAGFRWMPLAVGAQILKTATITSVGSLLQNGLDGQAAAKLTAQSVTGMTVVGTALALAVEVGLGRREASATATALDWRYINPLNDVAALILGQIILAKAGYGEAPSFAYESSLGFDVGRTDDGYLLISAPDNDFGEELKTAATPLMGLCAISLPLIVIGYCLLGYSACRPEPAAQAEQNGDVELALPRRPQANPVIDV